MKRAGRPAVGSSPTWVSSGPACDLLDAGEHILNCHAVARGAGERADELRRRDGRLLAGEVLGVDGGHLPDGLLAREEASELDGSEAHLRGAGEP